MKRALICAATELARVIVYAVVFFGAIHLTSCGDQPPAPAASEKGGVA